MSHTSENHYKPTLRPAEDVRSDNDKYIDHMWAVAQAAMRAYDNQPIKIFLQVGEREPIEMQLMTREEQMEFLELYTTRAQVTSRQLADENSAHRANGTM